MWSQIFHVFKIQLDEILYIWIELCQVVEEGLLVEDDIAIQDRHYAIFDGRSDYSIVEL